MEPQLIFSSSAVLKGMSFPNGTRRQAPVTALVSLTSRAITSYLRRRHLFHCFGPDGAARQGNSS